MKQAGAVRGDAARGPGDKEAGERRGVQSLERAFAILEAIAARPAGISLAELSKSVGLHTSTAYHLVRTMVARGYVRQDPVSKRYAVGRKIFALAAGLRSELDLVSLAESVLAELSAATGETAHLAILSGTDVAIVARTAGTGAFQLRESHGGLRPGHATALGKVLLASLEDERLAAHLGAAELQAFTPKTIVDRERLLAELRQVRASGIAYDDGEFSPEVRCVAVPVRDFTGAVVAAVGLSGPVWRVALQALGGMTADVQRAAEALSRELGNSAGASADVRRRTRAE